MPDIKEMDENMDSIEEEEEEPWPDETISDSSYHEDDSSDSALDKEDLSGRDSEWEDEIKPTIRNTSQALLHEWMNNLVVFYNQCLEIGTEGVVCDPNALRQGLDKIVQAVLGNSQSKMLSGTLPLYDFVIAVLSRLWRRLHPFSLESEFQRLWAPPARVFQPPFVDSKSIQEFICSGLRPLDALHSSVVNALEPQFKVHQLEHRDYPTAVSAAPYHDQQQEYREDLARLKRNSPTSGSSDAQASNANDEEDMEY